MAAEMRTEISRFGFAWTDDLAGVDSYKAARLVGALQSSSVSVLHKFPNSLTTLLLSPFQPSHPLSLFTLSYSHILLTCFGSYGRFDIFRSGRGGRDDRCD